MIDAEMYQCDVCEMPLYPEEVYGYNGTPYCKKCYTELFKIRYFIQYKNKFEYIPPNRSSAIAISETPIFKPYTESHLVREILKNLQILFHTVEVFHKFSLLHGTRR